MTGLENLKIEKFEGKDMGKTVESSRLEEFFDDKFFEDLENSDLKIYHKGSNYVFEQKDIHGKDFNENGDRLNKFNVDKKLFREYLQKQEQLEQENTKRHKLLKEFLAEMQSKEEQDDLKLNIINSNENINENLESVDNIIAGYKKIASYDKQDRINKSREGKQTLRDLKKESERRADILAGIKTKGLSSDIAQKQIDICKEELPLFQETLDMALLGMRGHVPILQLDKKSMDKYNIRTQNEIILRNKINETMKIMAENKLFLNEQENLKDYLSGVYNGDIKPSEHPFYLEHAADFLTLKGINSELYYYIFDRKHGPNTIRVVSTVDGNNNNRMNRNPRTKGSIEKGNMFSDALVKMGIIDENDKKKQAAWAKFGKIGALGLLAVGIYKIFTTKGKGRRGWIGATLGGVVAYNNADKIKNRFGDAFGSSDVDDICDGTNVGVEEANEYIKPQAHTLRCLGGIPMNTLVSTGILKEESGKISIDYDKYNDYANKYMEKDQAEIGLESMLAIKNSNDEDMVNKSFEYMGIKSLDDLQTLAGNDQEKTLLDTNNVSDYFENITSPVNSTLQQHGFEPKNPKAWYEITQEYDNNNFNDTKIIERANRGLIKFNDDRPYRLEDMIKNNNLDLTNKKIDGLTIKFKNYQELFDAAQLTKFIKNTFDGEKSVEGDTTPFHISTSGNIQFNNKDRWEVWDGDTDVINSNFYKNTLEKISPSLNNNKQTYVDYLNEQWS